MSDDLDLRFRPLAREDLPLLARWLREPHVDEWWDGPHTLEGVRAKYEPRIDGDEPVHCHLALDGDRPIGFVQLYRLGAEPEYAPDLELEPLAIGIDLYVGDASYLHRGVGHRLLARFVEQIVPADAPAIYIDPDPRNRRAVAAFRRAGFVPVQVVDRGDERVLLMKHNEPAPPPRVESRDEEQWGP